MRLRIPCFQRKVRFRVAQKQLKNQQEKVDKFQLYKVELARQLTIFSRWLENLKVHLIPWEAKIRRIESKRATAELPHLDGR